MDGRCRLEGQATETGALDPGAADHQPFFLAGARILGRRRQKKNRGENREQRSERDEYTVGERERGKVEL